jgi:hypothetical protein
MSALALLLSTGIAMVGWAAGEEVMLLGGLGPPGSVDELPAGWKPLLFKNIPATTRYRIVRDGDAYVLKADSHAAASGLYREVNLDPKVYRTLAWRWRVENVLTRADARRKDGDDYPARVYVTFQYDPDSATLWERTKYGTYKLLYGEYPPRAAINYIWDNRLPQGTSLDNAYTDRAKMIVVRSGADGVGRWWPEQRDVYEDYRRLFGDEPPPIAAIAVMTDTDNTGESAAAYYDRIVLRAVP